MTSSFIILSEILNTLLHVLTRMGKQSCSLSTLIEQMYRKRTQLDVSQTRNCSDVLFQSNFGHLNIFLALERYKQTQIKEKLEENPIQISPLNKNDLHSQLSAHNKGIWTAQFFMSAVRCLQFLSLDLFSFVNYLWQWKLLSVRRICS